jgi:hypothetical protein
MVRTSMVRTWMVRHRGRFTGSANRAGRPCRRCGERESLVVFAEGVESVVEAGSKWDRSGIEAAAIARLGRGEADGRQG